MDRQATGSTNRTLSVPVLIVLGWLVPGLGHLLLGRRLRALVFAVIIVFSFIVGIALQGELILPRAGEPLSYLAAVASIGAGVLFVLARLLSLGDGTVTAASFEYGTSFLLMSGMMNLLLLLDIHDIGVGKKDW